jgi:hypothetical protein
MILFHGHPAAAATNKFHRRQFILANMGVINTRGSTEAAFFCITAGIAQMPRFIGNRAAVFTCICHIVSPFLRTVR